MQGDTQKPRITLKSVTEKKTSKLVLVDLDNSKENTNNQEDFYFKYVSQIFGSRRVDLLKNWNIAMGVVHFVSFAAILVLSIVNQNKTIVTPVYTDFFVLGGALKNGNVAITGFGVDINLLGLYYPIWLLLAFPIITSIFHFVIAFIYYDMYLYNLIVKGTQIVRWIEYSITAGLMTWVIWSISGGTNFFQGFLLVGLNIIMNLLGAIHEELNASSSGPTVHEFMRIIKQLSHVTKSSSKRKTLTIDANSISSSKINSIFYFKAKETKWSALILGFFVFALIWTVILAYFFKAVGSNASGVPWFVWTINIGLLFTFSTFAINMIVHYINRNRLIFKNEVELNSMVTLYNHDVESTSFNYFLANRIDYEISYQVLSLINKLYLTWFLWIGLLTR